MLTEYIERMNRRRFLYFSSLLPSLAAEERGTSAIVYPGEDGRLVYLADQLGNCIPDFSNAGYMGGGVALPEAPVRRVVEAAGGDSTERIQQAIDEVSQMELDDAGLRGAVLLSRGRHDVGGTLRIAASGVVLRGEGQADDGTVLVATGTEQRTLIEVHGGASGIATGAALTVADEYVPVGARTFRLHSAGDLRPGETVIVRRVGNAAWISAIGMDRITPRPSDPGNTVQWKPFDLNFERRVTSVDGESISVDAPITCAIDEKWGGGRVFRFDEQARISNVGVEHLRGVSEFDAAIRKQRSGESYHADEQHAWTLISIDAAANAWVRNVTALHFGYACVGVRQARQVTVRDCQCAEMVSEITGSRRYPYSLAGQLILVERCTGDTGRHDFAVGARVCGPNVFLHCSASRSFASSEPHHRWSVGGLYDNVKANIAIQDRQWYGTGHGWSGAYYVAWNCEGPLVCQRPPTAQNWAIGHVGPKAKGAFGPREDGHWESHGRHVLPESLYLAQLRDRLGEV
jgi:hypothetical protein